MDKLWPVVTGPILSRRWSLFPCRPEPAQNFGTVSAMSLKKLGRYDLVRVLGKGAMGLVYEGRDPNLDRRVAIKTIKVDNLSEEDAAEYEVRFRTEAHSAARLQHPNIVSVYDSDRDIDIAYLVMEFIQGDDLKHHMDNGASYTLEQTVGIMTDLLFALDYAHRHGIVHRDIKPANLLMQASGRVKLTDFGVARIQETGEATRTQGSMVGTLKYMSPEQVQGRPIDGRADLFAAGVLLYQLLTGVRPFNGDSDFDIIQNIVGQTPAAPSTLNPGLPAEIDAVLARALEKSREARFATAQEFSLALQAATQDASSAMVRPPALFAPGGNGSSASTSGTWSETVLQRDLLVPTGTGTGTGVPPSVVTQEVELVYWKDIKDSSDPSDLRGFLAKFPAGIYADLARRSLKRLSVAQDEEATLVTPAAAVRVATVGTLPDASPDVDARSEASPVSVSATTVPRISEARVVGGLRVFGLHPVWGMGAVIALVGLGFYFSAAPEQPTEALPLSTPSTQAAPSLQPATSTASGTEMILETIAATAVVVSPAPAPATAAPTPAKLSKPLASKPAIASAPSDTKPSANGPETQASKLASSPAEPVNPVKSAKAIAPSVACEDRWLLAFQSCMNTQCAKPEFSRHPVCVERYELNQRRRDADKLRDAGR
jgi:serine/threonine protein kinase